MLSKSEILFESSANLIQNFDEIVISENNAKLIR